MRIIIETDSKEIPSTTVQPSGCHETPGSRETPSPELLAQAAALGAMNAGRAPSGIARSGATFDAIDTIDAGNSREHAASSEHAEGSKHKTP
jgi:hypothetical protein